MIVRDSMGTIREEDVDSWCFVRDGSCTREQALRVFHAFFELDGRERAGHLQLPVSY